MSDCCELIEQRWRSTPRNVQHARETVRTFSMQYMADQADLIELAIGEACANAIEHGSPSGTSNHFVLRCAAHPDKPEVVFEVEDEGIDFSLSDLPIGRPPDVESEGGRGLFIINQIMDEVTLHSTSRGLTVRMIKRGTSSLP